MSACTDVLWIGKPPSSPVSPASGRYPKKARGKAYWKLRSRSRPPVRRWSERGVVLYRGHPPKSRDAEAESLLERRRALFCCAEAPKWAVCRLRLRPVGREAVCTKPPGADGAPCSHVCSRRMNSSALKGWERGETPGGPSPAARCRPPLCGM